RVGHAATGNVNKIQTLRVDKIKRVIGREAVEVDASPLTDRIPSNPPLQIGIVEPVKVIIHPAVDVDFFAGEAIDVRARQRATAGNRVAEWVIPVAGGQRLAAVDQVSNVSVAIGVV